MQTEQEIVAVCLWAKADGQTQTVRRRLKTTFWLRPKLSLKMNPTHEMERQTAGTMMQYAVTDITGHAPGVQGNTVPVQVEEDRAWNKKLKSKLQPI